MVNKDEYNMCYGEPLQWVDFGDIWPWLWTLRAISYFSSILVVASETAACKFLLP